MAKILCIDDEVDFRNVLKQFLVSWGHDVVEAADGVAGLAAVLEDAPSIVICDRMMPQMNGMELLQTLRSDHPSSPEIPFIFLTALNDPRDQDTVADLIPAAYLTKPLKFDTLKAVIENVLETSSEV